MSSVAESHRRVRVGSVEPAAIALLKQIDPAFVFLTLLLCEFIYRDRYTPSLGVYASLTFIFAGQLFSRLEIREFGHFFSRTYGRILLQWLLVFAILLLFAFGFKVSADLSRKVVLTWFMMMPLALCASDALRRRYHWSATNGSRAPRHVIIGVNGVGVELARRLPRAGFLGYLIFVASSVLPSCLGRTL